MIKRCFLIQFLKQRIPANRGDTLKCLRNCDEQTDHNGEQGDTLDKSGGQDHVGTDVTGHFRLAGNGRHGITANVTNTETGTDGGETGTDSGAHLTDT